MSWLPWHGSRWYKTRVWEGVGDCRDRGSHYIQPDTGINRPLNLKQMRRRHRVKMAYRCFTSRQVSGKFRREHLRQFCSLSGWWLLTVQGNIPIFCRQGCRSSAVTLRFLDNMDKAIEDKDTECNSRKENECSCWSAYILSDLWSTSHPLSGARK